MAIQPGEDRVERPTGSAYRSRKKTNNTQSNSVKIPQEYQLKFVLRLIGKKSEETQEIIEQLPWYHSNDLEEVINETISLSNQK